jgi:asparagine synthase (glutamine-hydrolysing)
MTHIQAHRGPDDSGTWDMHLPDGSYLGLGSRRLAILDLSPVGHMPMCNPNRTLWITYNGEIYNFAALRTELEAKGHRFVSNTDTEVVLHLYEEEGPDSVRRLNGMFAFAICDLRGSSPALFLARDHFGVKPLYYSQRDSRLAFASEIKALLQVPGIEAEMDVEALHQYLTFLWVPDPKTMFRGVFKLPAGHHGLWQRGEFKITRYWDLKFPPTTATFPNKERELSEEVRHRFRHSVKSQMVSDVPVGAFLSSGLDSSSIVAMMAAETTHPVHTYTVTFPPKYRVGESTLDDPEVASRLARHLGCENQRIVVEPDVASLLPSLLWHMDEPTADPAIVTAYLVCREARKESTVLLSGVGGDELFAGYRKHIAHYWAQAYGRVPGTLRHLLEWSVNSIPSMRGTSVKGHIKLLKKMSRSASLAPVDRFIMNCTYLDDAQKEMLYNQELGRETRSFDPANSHREAFDRIHHADFLNQMLYVDSKIFMTSLNLTYNDKMSMASSVEVRVPFLDHELAEFVAQNVPPEMKLKGLLFPKTKHIFREGMTGILPKEVLRQPKAGFAAPIDYWLANDLKEIVDDLLSVSRIRERGLFQPHAVRRIVTEHRAGKQDWSMQIWQLLTLEIWMQTFLEKQQSTDLCGGARLVATA